MDNFLVSIVVDYDHKVLYKITGFDCNTEHYQMCYRMWLYVIIR